MKNTQLILILCITLISAACNSTKKTVTTSSATTIASTSEVVTKSKDGVYAPGTEELMAIQGQYKDVTMENLKQGYLLYTKGACINCHGAVNIYKYDEVQWKIIVDNMAQKAYLSDVEKDAVYKYVLAIKATQPKGIK